MLIIVNEPTLVAIFTSKHMAVVHAQTTRMQHKTLCENDCLDNSGIRIEFEWIRKGMDFKSTILNGYLPCTLPQNNIKHDDS